ncbi:MAG: von Willebrand factor type A domain-containing protein [Chloroflexota bacterium]
MSQEQARSAPEVDAQPATDDSLSAVEESADDEALPLAEPPPEEGTTDEAALLDESSLEEDIAEGEAMDDAVEEFAASEEGTDLLTDEAPPVNAPPQIEVNPFIQTTQDNLSTFALDVDTASYASARNYITSDQLPPPDAVRVEEFVNYFDYKYPAPEQDAFGIYIDAATTPFGAAETHIARVGIQGKIIDTNQREDASLVFVIDVSGSMEGHNRLSLVKESLTLLVEELNDDDQVAIVVYGSTARTVLEPTSITRKEVILDAINSVQIEGSTNAEAGLEMGYELASKHFKNDGINRVILCSDGVANVGATDPEGIRKTIRDYTAQGVYLTTVGFGMGNYNDYLMEQLANDGNGNYAYVDTLDEAQRVFVENLTGTLQVIAKDAKLQVEFNPDVVERYRLLGYENRAVADDDFRNDRVDAGEVGAGHNVTALYEIVLREQSSSDTAFTVHMRYADPETGDVQELAVPFYRDGVDQDFASATPSLQLAVTVAGFAEQLRGGEYEQNYTLNDVYEVSQQIAPQFANDTDVQEFMQLVEQAQRL